MIEIFSIVLLMSYCATTESEANEPTTNQSAQSRGEAEGVKAGSTVALDEKNGFRDAIFGIEIPQNSKIWVKVKTNEDKTVFYIRPKDRKELGPAKLDQIVYIAYKGKLIGVVLTAKKDNGPLVMETLKAAFGAPETDEDSEVAKWVGARVLVKYERNMFSKEATITYFSIPGVLELNEDSRSSAASATDEL